jgi:hypothetical protein
MRRTLSLFAALALASCGRPIPPPECLPTTIQPASDDQVTIIGRLSGCDNLVVVGLPGYPLRMYVLPERLRLSDEQLLSLPVVPRGEG